ncbi:MAG: hypothetical protein PUC33_04265 [Oscillospiraceae bacterium]|nr:hypothetical protein [Oscillospiraceae bacterium]MDD6146755.1 hypothetical protein [Oscillospiraceae bacterium]
MADILAKFEQIWQAVWAWFYKCIAYFFPEYAPADETTAAAE